MINYTVQDVSALAVSTLSYALLVWAPGFALAWAGRFALSDEPPGVIALLCGLALTPLIESLVVREVGVGAGLTVNLLLAGAGLWLALRAGWRPKLSRLDAILLLAWFLVVATETVDFDTGRLLFEPYSRFDGVKHAATIAAIVDTGAPPRDPFFARPERAGYYYFFYTVSALSKVLGGRLVDARAAFAGLMFWTGVGLHGLVRLCLARARLVGAPWSRRTSLMVFAVMAIGGLDLAPVALAGVLTGMWLPDPLLWNNEAAGVVSSLIWVPHHIASLIAAMLGFAALSCPQGPAEARRAIFAGGCFASALGLSVWVTIVAVAVAAVWGVRLALARRWRTAGMLILAGTISLLLAGPQIHDMLAGRAPGRPPFALDVRAFTLVDIFVSPGAGRELARLAALPINYGLEFGLVALGAWLYLRRKDRPGRGVEFNRLLAIAAASGLLIGAFTRSTIVNNDLGWRAMLFPLLTLLVWTLSDLDVRLAKAGGRLRRVFAGLPAAYGLLAAIGLGTTAYALGANRAYVAMPLTGPLSFTKAEPRTARALRSAYVWASANLPPGLVLQQSPAPPRVFDFGLYGRNPTGVADQQGALYGADETAVANRLNILSPIFTQDLAAADVTRRARSQGVGALVVDVEDAPWRDARSWVWTTRPLYADPRVRILSVEAIGAKS